MKKWNGSAAYRSHCNVRVNASAKWHRIGPTDGPTWSAAIFTRFLQAGEPILCSFRFSDKVAMAFGSVCRTSACIAWERDQSFEPSFSTYCRLSLVRLSSNGGSFAATHRLVAGVVLKTPRHKCSASFWIRSNICRCDFRAEPYTTQP